MNRYFYGFSRDFEYRISIVGMPRSWYHNSQLPGALTLTCFTAYFFANLAFCRTTSLVALIPLTIICFLFMALPGGNSDGSWGQPVKN